MKIIKENDLYSLVDIARQDNKLVIKGITGAPRSNDIPENLFRYIIFHIANVPEVLKGLDFVFHAPDGRGEDYNISANGDIISVISYTDPVLRMVSIVTYKNNEDIKDMFDFHLRGFDFPANESERVYTPAMLWVTKQLKKIYNDWQKEHPEYERVK